MLFVYKELDNVSLQICHINFVTKDIIFDLLGYLKTAFNYCGLGCLAQLSSVHVV